jgi:hypothetical protein
MNQPLARPSGQLGLELNDGLGQLLDQIGIESAGDVIGTFVPRDSITDGVNDRVRAAVCQQRPKRPRDAEIGSHGHEAGSALSEPADCPSAPSDY